MEGQVLVVDPGEEDVVEENFFIQPGAPGSMLPQGQGVVGKLEEEGEGITVQITGGQVGL